MAYSLFISILCLLLSSSFSLDTLVPDQTISVNQTSNSQNQDFEMGFFSPGKSSKEFLGIWYKNTPDVVVWVANRNHPISDPHRVTFAVSKSGALVISRGGKIIWSAIPSQEASKPVLQLMNTGNLVVVNQTMEGFSQSYIWQSFDYPTDTHLQGMKLVYDIEAGVGSYLRSWRSWDDPSPGDFVQRFDNQGLSEYVVYRGEKKMYRSGKWNGIYFGALPILPSPIFNSNLKDWYPSTIAQLSQEV